MTNLPHMRSSLPEACETMFTVQPLTEPSISLVKSKIRHYLDMCDDTDSLEELITFLVSKVDSSWVHLPSLPQTQFALLLFYARCLVMPLTVLPEESRQSMMKLMEDTIKTMDLPECMEYVVRQQPAIFVTFLDFNFDMLRECEEMYRGHESWKNAAVLSSIENINAEEEQNWDN
jgi:hypothetical protein